MKSKSKSMLIAFLIVLVIVFVVMMVRRKGSSAGVPDLVSSSGPAGTDQSGGSAAPDDFLASLLNVQNIKLDESIFSDPAFASLHDSSILLIPDGTEGRPNPFAPIGSDAAAVPVAPAAPAQ